MQSNPRALHPISLGYRPEENSPQPQVTQKKPNQGTRILLTENIKKGYSQPVPKSTKRVPTKVAFIPNEEERRLIQTVQSRLGINKATDVLRMGLKRLAEGVKVAG